MTCTITLTAPVSSAHLRMVLAHAEAMAENVDVLVDRYAQDGPTLKVRLDGLRLAEPVRPVVVRDVVATADSGFPPSDEAPEPEGAPVAPEPDGPAPGPDDEPPVDAGCDIDGEDFPADVTPPAARQHQPGSTGWAMLTHIASEGGVFHGGWKALAGQIRRPNASVTEASTRLRSAGLIEQENANARVILAIRLTADGWAHIGQEPPAAPPTAPEAPEPDEATPDQQGYSGGPSPFCEGTAGWEVLEFLAELGGTFAGSVAALGDSIGRGFAFAGVESTVRRLRLADLIELEKPHPRKVTAIRLTAAGWQHLGRTAPTTPEPAVEDDSEPTGQPAGMDPVPTDPRWDPGWGHMRRTDKTDRDSAPKRNVLDPVLGAPEKGRPLIDSVEVIEELSDEELAVALGKAGAR